jgi:hypothetical protein
LTGQGAPRSFGTEFPMILNVALVALITVVVALVAATLNNNGRLAEAKRS